MLEMKVNELEEVNGGAPWLLIGAAALVIAGTLVGCPNNCDK